MITEAETEVKDLLRDLERRYNKAMITGSVVKSNSDADGKSQLQQIQRARKQLTGELRATQQENSKLQKELQQCQVALRSTRNALLNTQAELVTAKNRYQTLETERKSLQQGQREVDINTCRSPSTTQELQAKVREVQSQLNIERAANSRQSSELEDAHRRYLSAQMAVADGTAQLAKLEQALEQSRLQSVRQQEQYQKQVKQLQATLAVTSQELKRAQAAGQVSEQAYLDEQSKSQALQRTFASAQLGALMQIRNMRQQAKWLNTWRIHCFSNKEAQHHHDESKQQLQRLEARYKQKIKQLQSRHDYLRNMYGANLIERFQRIRLRAAYQRTMSIWKAATIQAFGQQQFKAETTDTGHGPPSPLAMGDDRVALAAEIDRLHEILKLKDAEISSQHATQSRLKILLFCRLLQGNGHAKMRRAFSHWQRMYGGTIRWPDSTPDRFDESKRIDKMSAKVSELQQLVAHVAYAWKSQYIKQTAFHAWKEFYLRSVASTLNGHAHAASSHESPTAASATDRFRQNSPNLWQRWRLGRGRGMSNAVQKAGTQASSDFDAAVSLVTDGQPKIRPSPLPLRNARKSQRLHGDELPDEQLSNEAAMLRKVLFLSPGNHGKKTDPACRNASPEGMSDTSEALPATCHYFAPHDFLHEIYHEVQEQQRQSGNGEHPRSRIHRSTQATSPNVVLQDRNGTLRSGASHWELTKPSKERTPKSFDLMMTGSMTNQARMLHQLVARVGKEGMIQDMITRLRIRIQETVYEAVEKLLACVDADFRDYKIPRSKVRPLSKAMRTEFCELVRLEACTGTLRWLLVLYLRAYATILRDHAGQAVSPSLGAGPTDAYRRVLRDLTVDLAQDVAEFRAARVLETNHSHKSGVFVKNDQQMLYLDSGAGPREYWKVISHSKKAVQNDGPKAAAEHELWRLAVCVRCQTRSEGLSLLRNDPQRQLLDKTMYMLMLYYTFVVIWDSGDILANDPNGIGL